MFAVAINKKLALEPPTWQGVELTEILVNVVQLLVEPLVAKGVAL